TNLGSSDQSFQRGNSFLEPELPFVAFGAGDAKATRSRKKRPKLGDVQVRAGFTTAYRGFDHSQQLVLRNVSRCVFAVGAHSPCQKVVSNRRLRARRPTTFQTGPSGRSWSGRGCVSLSGETAGSAAASCRPCSSDQLGRDGSNVLARLQVQSKLLCQIRDDERLTGVLEADSGRCERCQDSTREDWFLPLGDVREE